ncbi:hypothetical protein CANCADRAFT_97688 [Tortispora caseinolytica NRRL Y-17796]|uniref:Uncharacterized protein n=1 Tax=Tortispora caseinolytica NRRL Y-17796 TaxID=767744 RepID=A0A1E4TE08_9ASCO|nr:hypothetical protein CANCADRAFT_97688 [Tortispora caseinolytica NRRL Y-17796]
MKYHDSEDQHGAEFKKHHPGMKYHEFDEEHGAEFKKYHPGMKYHQGGLGHKLWKMLKGGGCGRKAKHSQAEETESIFAPLYSFVNGLVGYF